MGVMLVKGVPVVRLVTAIGFWKTGIGSSCSWIECWQLRSGTVKSHRNFRARRPGQRSTGDVGLVVNKHPSRIEETLVPFIDHASDPGLFSTIMCTTTGRLTASIGIRRLVRDEVASKCMPVDGGDISRVIVTIRLRERNIFSSRARCNCQRVLEHEAWALKCAWPFVEVPCGRGIHWRF